MNDRKVNPDHKIIGGIKMKQKTNESKTDLLLSITQIGSIVAGILLIIIPAINNASATNQNYDDMVMECMATQTSITETEIPFETSITIEEEPVDVTTELTSVNVVHRSSFSEVVRDTMESNTTEEVSEDYEITDESITINNIDNLDDVIGYDKINIDGHTLVRYSLPNEYYPGLDYSSFQPYMDYRTITKPNSSSYPVVHGEDTYNDELGLRRSIPDEDEFVLNDEDDYMIALGTYYKPKGVCGLRYLIVTSTGMYTAITGDEKGDSATDPHNMYSYHGNNKGGVIEWIVDTSKLPREVKTIGSVTAGPVEELNGEILHIYLIED